MRLKENPRDWQKFTAGVCAAAAVLIALLWRRRIIQPPAVWGLFGVVASILVVCMIRPVWFRSFYRGGMTASFHIGQVVGRIVLVFLFLAVVTPLGLLLKLLGKDLLRLKRNASAQTYWQPVRKPNSLDQQF